VGTCDHAPIVGVFVVLLWAVKGEDVQANMAVSLSQLIIGRLLLAAEQPLYVVSW